MPRTRWPTLVAAFVVAGSVAAQTFITRNLPEDAPRAYLSHIRESLFSLDGRETKLAPGGQIRGQNNLLVLPAAVPKESLVKYQLDKSGELYRVWILTKEEEARPDRSSPASAQGRPIEQVLPKNDPPPLPKFGAPPPRPPDTPTRSTN